MAWSDGCVRLISAESSKIVHQFSSDDQVSKVTCMGWSSNKTTKSTAPNYLNIAKEIKSFIQEDDTNFCEDSVTLLDLPRDLSLINIETSLPKLSTLPSGGDSEDIFCSGSSLDALFTSIDPKDDHAVDVMVFGTKEGKIHIIIYDSFLIGSFNSPVVEESSSFLVLHASQEYSSTHTLIVKGQKTENLFFVAMDLRFISAPNGNLSVLASRSTALQNLLRYIYQVQGLMFTEWKSSQELPNKLLRNINETLNEKYKCNIVQALSHSLATGHIYPPVKEWLMHEISERGHKRWEKAVLTGLGNLKRIVHENMLPALERFTVILSRFLGIARFQPLNETVGFTSHHISLLMDTVACLHLISSKILSQVVDEIDLFTSFSAWLRYEIDQLSSDSSSNFADDTTERESLIDHSKVFFYLQNVMTCTALADHFIQSQNLQDTNELSQDRDLLFEILSQQLKNQKKGLNHNKSILSVKFHCDELSSRAIDLFKRIAESEKCNVIFGKESLIGMADPHSPMDMKLDMKDMTNFLSYFAFVPKGMYHCVRVIRVNLSLENGISSLNFLESFTIQLGEGIIKDIKFSDVDTLFVLWKYDQSIELLDLPFKEIKTTSHQATNLAKLNHDVKIEYSPYFPTALHRSNSTTITPEPIIFIDTCNVPQYFSKYKIPKEDHFIPGSLCVRRINEENQYQHQKLTTTLKTRENLRIILLSRDGCRYKVFSGGKTS